MSQEVVCSEPKEEEEEAPTAKRIKVVAEPQQEEKPRTKEEKNSSSSVLAKKNLLPAAVVKKQADPPADEATNLPCGVSQSSNSNIVVKHSEKDDDASSIDWHYRHNCPVQAFELTPAGGNENNNMVYCDRCLCYACGGSVPAGQCPKWRDRHHEACQWHPYWRVRHEEREEIRRWREAHPDSMTSSLQLFDRSNDQVDLVAALDRIRAGIPDPAVQRCRENRFYYPDRAAFDRGLHIYNLQSVVPGRNLGYYFPQQLHEFVRKTVKAPHKKPCSDCERPFVLHMPFFIDNVRSYGCYDKYCLGCMGRIVAFHVSPDPTALDAKLAAEKTRIAQLVQEAQREFDKHKAQGYG